MAGTSSSECLQYSRCECNGNSTTDSMTYSNHRFSHRAFSRNIFRIDGKLSPEEKMTKIIQMTLKGKNLLLIEDLALEQGLNLQKMLRTVIIPEWHRYEKIVRKR